MKAFRIKVTAFFVFSIFIPFLLDFLSLLAVRNDTENGTN